jgi:ferredoxin
MLTTVPDSIATTPALPTAEKIAELFLAHDILPNRLTYLRPSECSGAGKCEACAVGILLVDVLGNERAVYDRLSSFVSARYMLRQATGWPVEFIHGVDTGFTSQGNGDDPSRTLRLIHSYPELFPEPDAFREGYVIGWRAAEIVGASRGPG